MAKNKLPVVWGLDRKYLLQAFVVMRSILMNSEEQYHFILLTADVVQNDVPRYTDVLKKEFSNFEVSVRNLDGEYFLHASIHNPHLSKAAYFRLLISELVPEYEKCIYLDCDLLVYGDLKELYDIEIENYYLAGVKDCHIIEDTPYQLEHEQVLGIPDRSKYINSGVMVVNLEKIRKDHLTNCFLNQLNKDNWYEDQDVLNVCCYPAIKILPLKYNLFHLYTGKRIKFLYGLPYEKQDFDFDPDHPFIMHLGGALKPWNSYAVRGCVEWWKTAEVFAVENSYQYYRKKCREEKPVHDLRDMIRQVEKRKNVVIWGYGKNGRRLCDIFSEYELKNIAAIVDNNKDTWGSQYRGITINSMYSIMEEYQDILWIITPRMVFSEITAQLKQAGVNEEDILYYKNRYDEYFYLLSLREEFYGREIENIADTEYIRQIPDRYDREQYIKDIIYNPMRYKKEYDYLAEKYSFRYWIQI